MRRRTTTLLSGTIELIYLLARKLRSIGFVTKLEPPLPLHNSFVKPDIVAWMADDPDAEILVLDLTIVSDDGRITLRPWLREK